MILRLVTLALAGFLAGCASERFERFEYARAAMGTRFELLFFAEDRASADAAAAAAFARIEALERAFTDYDAESEIGRLGRRSDERTPTEWIPLSAELCAVLERAAEIAAASGGAFDVTVGPYVRLWRRARRQGELASALELAEARPSVGFEKLELDPRGGRVRLHAPRMRLDLGGIGKGFALDRALAVLAERGVEHALAVGGGDVVAAAAPPGRSGWRVALAGFEGPLETLELARAALSSSGDLARFVEVDGVRYSHVLDPRTGAALCERRLASVLAPSGAEADALATALCVLGPDAGFALIDERPSTAARIVELRAGRSVVFRSTRFPTSVSCDEPRADAAPEPRSQP